MNTVYGLFMCFYTMQGVPDDYFSASGASRALTGCSDMAKILGGSNTRWDTLDECASAVTRFYAGNERKTPNDTHAVDSRPGYHQLECRPISY
jgi:hypothetical protein